MAAAFDKERRVVAIAPADDAELAQFDAADRDSEPAMVVDGQPDERGYAGARAQ